MSKELIERARAHRNNDLYESKNPLVQELADALEAQQKRIEQLEADTQEVAAARIYLREKGALLRDLAASQAHIKVLRGVLERIESATMSMYATRSDLVNDLQSVAYKALATPQDDSALRERLKAERERAAKLLAFAKEYIEAWDNGMAGDSSLLYTAKAAIRAMEDQ